MIDIKPINHGFGADIGGIDLATITDADFEIIYQAWLDYGVLRFHDQKLTKDHCRLSASVSAHWRKSLSAN